MLSASRVAGLFAAPITVSSSIVVLLLRTPSISMWSLAFSKPLIVTLLAVLLRTIVSLIALKFLSPVSSDIRPDSTFSTLISTFWFSAFESLLRSTPFAPLAFRTRLVPLSSIF